MNSATDNPMVFAEDGELLSGGNFHGQSVAFLMDFLKIAVAELGNISERRTERLVNPALSKLPAFLVREGGLNSGLMVSQVTAAAQALEFLKPLKPAKPLIPTVNKIRELIPPWDKDRNMADDILKMKKLIHTRSIATLTKN